LLALLLTLLLTLLLPLLLSILLRILHTDGSCSGSCNSGCSGNVNDGDKMDCGSAFDWDKGDRGNVNFYRHADVAVEGRGHWDAVDVGVIRDVD
jgi:hypothetical protein